MRRMSQIIALEFSSMNMHNEKSLRIFAGRFTIKVPSGASSWSCRWEKGTKTRLICQRSRSSSGE